MAGGRRISSINQSVRTGKDELIKRNLNANHFDLTRMPARSPNARARCFSHFLSCRFKQQEFDFHGSRRTHKCSHSLTLCVLNDGFQKITFKLYLKKNEIKKFNCFHLPLARSLEARTTKTNKKKSYEVATLKSSQSVSWFQYQQREACLGSFVV